MKPPPSADVARAPLPVWLSVALPIVAVLYLVMLVFHQFRHNAWPKALQAPMLFIESTELFPTADRYATEFKLEGYSCREKAWQPMDPRPYFPMHGDDKESRFQRIVHFYDEDKKATGSKFLRPVMRALEHFILDGHGAGADDGVAGPIGGIHIYQALTPIPAPGDDIARYEYRPLEPAPVDDEHRAEVYRTPEAHLAQTCPNGTWVDYPVRPEPEEAR